MKTLRDLQTFVKKQKTFMTDVYFQIDGKYLIQAVDYGYDKKEQVFYILCEDEGTPITVKELLAASYKYPNAEIRGASETLRTFMDVKGFSVNYGDGNFGEPNSLVCL